MTLVSRWISFIQEHLAQVGTVFVVLVTLALGQGGCWAYRNHQLAIQEQRLDIRGRIGDLYRQILEETDLYVRLR